MSNLAPIKVIGGQGGNAFDFNGMKNGATLKKIWVWVFPHKIKAIRVFLTDGRFRQFGEPWGDFSDFTFEDGERFTNLSLRGNGDGTRLGGIKFETNCSREFFVHMTDGEQTTEHPIDIGSGICMGITGRAGADIDCVGFIFIHTIKSTLLTDIQYPTLHSEIPSVAVEMKSTNYTNNSTLIQQYKLKTSKTITKKSTWTMTNKLECTFNMQVKAGIPEVVEVSGGYSYNIGTENLYQLENSEQKTELLSLPIRVPPGKTVDMNITIGRATVELPYNATVLITCYNGSVVQFPTSGTYKGLNYTDVKIVVNESAKSL